MVIHVILVVIHVMHDVILVVVHEIHDMIILFLIQGPSISFFFHGVCQLFSKSS